MADERIYTAMEPATRIRALVCEEYGKILETLRSTEHAIALAQARLGKLRATDEDIKKGVELQRTLTILRGQYSRYSNYLFSWENYMLQEKWITLEHCHHKDIYRPAVQEGLQGLEALAARFADKDSTVEGNDYV